MSIPTTQSPTKWWNHGTVYQVYVRSFADGSGDGIGDLLGLRQRLDHIERLGVDAIWLNPCYASPQRDHGYDIADYFAIDPVYGTVSDLEELVRDAHGRGIRVLLDIVANHCSSDHEWFVEALSSTAGSAQRERFIFRDGRGESGELPPNNWQSVFGGSAWTRVIEADGSDGQWYLHAFDSSQPDFNWRNPEVADYFDEVLAFWFDKGIDGFRIDVAHGMVKHADLPDWTDGGHNYAMWDQPEVHDIYRRWRRLGSAHPAGEKYFVGEIWVPSVEALEQYLAVDELHQAFTFDLLVQPWHAASMREAIDSALARESSASQPPAWTLANHDVHRQVTRYGQEQLLDEPLPADKIAAARRRGPVDLSRGIARARAAILLELALPGAVYLYQGEELGLPEVFDLPDESRQDPIWLRSAGLELGRDGCRVPLPWASSEPSFGFSSAAEAVPWLPQPSWFADFAAESQYSAPDSMFEHYRSALAARSEVFGGGTSVQWMESEISVLAFRRGEGVCVVNFSTDATSVHLPGALPVTSSDVVTRSGDSFVIPPDCAVWFALTRIDVDLAETPTHPAREGFPAVLESTAT